MSGEVMVPEPSPPRSETLQGLAARVAAATGPDRELDEALFDALDNPRSFFSIRYTSSLDAALALVERVLPGRVWSVTNFGSGSAVAVIYVPGEVNGVGWEAPTPALALLSALLAALAKPTTADESGTGRRENPTPSSLPSKLEQPE